MKGIVGKEISSAIAFDSSKIKVAKQFGNLITNVSRTFDKIAGFTVVSIMVLVVSNVIMRTLFNCPILGTYEYVGFLTAVTIAFALAYCAIQDGHIAVNVMIERFSPRIKRYINIVVNIIALLFIGTTAWSLLVYAADTKSEGLVSSTTQAPVYPFIYLVSIGFVVLAFVHLVKLADSIKKAEIHDE